MRVDALKIIGGGRGLSSVGYPRGYAGLPAQCHTVVILGGQK